MKMLFVSFAVGLGVGVIYGLIRVKSPAPPIVALLGLLGMVLGEQLGIWIHTKELNVSQAASVCLVGERYDGRNRRTCPSTAKGNHYFDSYQRAGNAGDPDARIPKERPGYTFE